MYRLVQNFLDVSTISAGVLVPTCQSVDISSVVHDVVTRMSDFFAQAGCDLRVECSPSLSVMGDRTAIDQIITNLMSNAMKYGRGKPVDVTLKPHEGGVLLCVRDNGVGITTSDHDKIFEKFERSSSGHESSSGHGLGLWIVKSLVEQMRGTVSVSSVLGGGALFKVHFPAPDRRSSGSRLPDEQ